MILALLPLSHFVLGVLCYAHKRASRGFAALGWCIGVAISVFLLVATRDGSTLSLGLGGWPAELGIGLRFDAVAAAFAPLLLLLELAVLLYARKGERDPLFYALLQFLLGAVFALLLAVDLFNEYAILELLTLVSFLLVGYERRATQVWASLKYLILASIGMSLFLVGVALVYHHTGTLNLSLIADIVRARPNAPWIPLTATLLAVGVAVKAGVLGLSQWLPAAHSAAPTEVSALLSGLVIKMGIVVLLRVSQVFPLGLLLQVLGTMTALVGVLYAAYARNLKRMLAFHTLSQIGYLVLGLSVGTPDALAGVLDYAIAHGLFKGLLFLAAGEAKRAAGGDRFAELAANRRSIPNATIAALLLGTLAIVGLPPLAGFGAKAALLDCHPNRFVFAVFYLTTIGTAFSFAKLIPLFRWHRGTARSDRIGAYATLALPILFFIPLTVTALPSLDLAAEFEPLLVIESLAAIAIGTLLHRLLRRRTPRLPVRLFFLEEAVLAILIAFLVAAALIHVH